MRTLLLIFTCKRPKYADTGGRGGQKTVKFCGRPSWMAPKGLKLFRTTLIMTNAGYHKIVESGAL